MSILNPNPIAPPILAENPRLYFTELLAINPNYFGSLPNSGFLPVASILGNTEYEQLTCLGYNPDTQRLEAVIEVKQPTGYRGSPCLPGSYEYVRFFVDYGSGFEDAGLAAANVHDIPNAQDCHKQSEKPLFYAVSVQLAPRRNWCASPLLPKVRAILSWNAIPTAGDPGYSVIWGQVLEANIQIKPRPILFKDIAMLNESVKLILPPEEIAGIAAHPIPLPDPAPLTLVELAKLYTPGAQADAVAGEQAATAAQPVPAHRFGYAHLQAALSAQTASPLAIASNIESWKQVGLSWQDSISSLAQLSANTTYEQLTCLGLEGGYGLERLVANFVIKRPYGYNGGLCAAGSTEYVAFWADWENTCRYTYLGTVAVRVHDIAKIPADGLVYSAALPVSLGAHRLPCDKPHVGRVRAVLSWNAPPSTTNPDALTPWGNLLDAHVQIQPGTAPNPFRPLIGILGGIPTSMINSGTGFTTPSAAFALTNQPADAYGRACPFGGVVSVQGESFVGYKYKVTVQPSAGGAVKTLNTPILLTRFDGTTYMSYPDAAGFFTYVDPLQNLDSLLAEWSSSGDDSWNVTLQIADLSGNPIVGALPDTHLLQLDNTAPEATVHIASSGDCGRFPQGTVLTGNYVAWDANFGSFSLGTSPFEGPVVPSGGDTPTLPLPSTGSSWSLNTATLKPCGYVVELGVSDLSIVNSSPGSHNYASSSVGFCLVPNA